jgi:hypothetical protein
MIITKTRLLVVLLLILVVGLVLWLTRKSIVSRNVALIPPVVGLGDSVQIDVLLFSPPIHLQGDRFLSGPSRPDWLPAVTALMSPDILSWDKLQEFASTEYLAANRITPELLEKARQGASTEGPRISIYYCVKVVGDIGEFMMVAHSAGQFRDSAPSKPTDIGLILLKRIAGRWKQFPYQGAQGLQVVPWNSLAQLEALLKAGRASEGADGKLRPD